MSPILTIDLAKATKKALWLAANALTKPTIAAPGVENNTWSETSNPLDALRFW